MWSNRAMFFYWHNLHTMSKDNTTIAEQVAQRVRQAERGKEFKDTDVVNYTRKYQAQYDLITSQDLTNIEADNVTAYKLIEKGKIWPPYNVAELKAAGFEPGAAYLMVKCREALSSRPMDSKDARGVYVRNIEKLRAQLAQSKTAIGTRDLLKAFVTDVAKTFDFEPLPPGIDRNSYTGRQKLQQYFNDIFGKRFYSFCYFSSEASRKVMTEALVFQEVTPEMEAAERLRREQATDRFISSLEKVQAELPQTADDYRSLSALFYNNGLTYNGVPKAKVIEAVQQSIAAQKAKRANIDAHIPAYLKAHPADWSWSEGKKQEEKPAPAAGVDEEFNKDPKRPQTIFEKYGITDWKKATKRTPLDYIKRTGGLSVENIDVKDVVEKFGYRNVVFGNYVNNAERKEHLRHFLGAMLDLHETINLDVKPLNQLGGLDVNFGATGCGTFSGAMACYMANLKAINMTKKRGDGCIAHEWGHYLDNVLGEGTERRATEQNYATFNKQVLRDSEKIKTLFQEWTNWLNNAGGERMVKVKFNPSKKYRYSLHGTTAAEAVEYAKKRYPKFAMYDSATNADVLRYYGYIAYKLNDKQPIEVEMKTTLSYYKYISSLWEAGSTKEKEYYTNSKEMFARAFEWFVEDALKRKGRVSNYLVDIKNNLGDVAILFPPSEWPYPYEEKEKVFIRDWFDRLFSAIRTEYTIPPFHWDTTERADEYSEYAKDKSTSDGIVVGPDGTPENVGDGDEIIDLPHGYKFKRITMQGRAIYQLLLMEAVGKKGRAEKPHNLYISKLDKKEWAIYKKEDDGTETKLTEKTWKNLKDAQQYVADNEMAAPQKAEEPRSKTIKFADLPEDMQVLIFQLAEDAGNTVHPNQEFTIVPRALTDFKPELDKSRGDGHVAEMVGKGNLPPIVTGNSKLLDGNHRIAAAAIEGRENIDSIDISDLVKISAVAVEEPVVVTPETTNGSTYQKRIAENFKHMGTKAEDWTSVPIVGEDVVEGSKGKDVRVPIFEMPQGYKSANTLFPQSKTAPFHCELCSKQPIGVLYWLQNDNTKEVLSVGSECVTHFGEGKSGQENVKDFRIQQAAELANEMRTLYNRILGEKSKVESRGYGKKERVWSQSLTYNPGTTSPYWEYIDAQFKEWTPELLYKESKSTQEIKWRMVADVIPVFMGDVAKPEEQKNLLSWYTRNKDFAEKLGAEIRRALDIYDKANTAGKEDAPQKAEEQIDEWSKWFELIEKLPAAENQLYFHKMLLNTGGISSLELSDYGYRVGDHVLTERGIFPLSDKFKKSSRATDHPRFKEMIRESLTEKVGSMKRGKEMEFRQNAFFNSLSKIDVNSVRVGDIVKLFQIRPAGDQVVGEIVYRITNVYPPYADGVIVSMSGELVSLEGVEVGEEIKEALRGSDFGQIVEDVDTNTPEPAATAPEQTQETPMETPAPEQKEIEILTNTTTDGEAVYGANVSHGDKTVFIPLGNFSKDEIQEKAEKVLSQLKAGTYKDGMSLEEMTGRKNLAAFEREQKQTEPEPADNVSEYTETKKKIWDTLSSGKFKESKHETAKFNALNGSLEPMVEDNPALFKDYVGFMMKLPKKYQPLDYTVFREGDGSWPNVKKWLSENKLTVHDLFKPESAALPRAKSFEVSPEDETFMKIHSQIIEPDEFRPIMMGTHFDDDGAVSTDARVMLFTPYRGGKKFNGTFCNIKNCKKFEEAVGEKTKYPAYQNVIPQQNQLANLNAEAMYTWLKHTERHRLTQTDKGNPVGVYINDERFAFGENLLLTAITAMLELGHKHLQIGYSSPRRGILIVPAGRLREAEERKADFVLVMPVLADDDWNLSYFDVETGCETDPNGNVYCFDEQQNRLTFAEERAKRLEERLAQLERQQAEEDAKELNDFYDFLKESGDEIKNMTVKAFRSWLAGNQYVFYRHLVKDADDATVQGYLDKIQEVPAPEPAAAEPAPAPAAEPTLADYQAALTGAEVMLEYAEGTDKADLEDYISGLKVMIETLS